MSKQSRFFATGNDSSESSDSDSNEENVDEKKVPARFARGGNASSDSEPEVEQKRVVRSQKDKQLDELNKTIKTLRNAMNINDWNAIQNDFDLLNKQILKSTSVTQGGMPRFYIKMLADLEEFQKKTLENKEAKKKMSPTNAKSLNSMKNKLKKHNKQYEKEIEAYLKNPDDSDGEGEADGKESDSDNEPTPKAAPSKQAQAAPKRTTTTTTEDSDSEQDGEGENEKDEEAEGSEEEDTDSDGESYRRSMEAEKNRKNKWMAKEDKEKSQPPAVKPKPPKTDKPKPTTKIPTKVEPPTVQGPEKVDQELTPEMIDQKLKEIIEMRGRKKTNRQEQIATLKSLVKKAKTPDRQLMVYLQLVSFVFDLSPGHLSIMPVANWKKCHKYTTRILNILNENPGLRLQEGGERETLSRQAEQQVEQPEDGEQSVHVEGNLLAFVERLHDEFIKSLIDPAFIDPHTHAYLLRLQDEAVLVELASGVQEYYERIGKVPSAARVAGVRVEHIYYKLDQPKKKEKEDGDKTDAKPEQSDPKYDTRALLNKLAHFIYLHADQRLRSKTILCQTYYEALHDRFYEARDLMLMSHLQDDVQHMDLPTQILFNRTMVQLGLCAFRNGLIFEAHGCLSEICMGGARVKELLAQGIANNRFGDKDQDKQVARRQVPYHMHINLELLECVHLISAMLLEIPNMAANSFDPKKKVMSRTFRRLYDQFERAIFNGPPENARENVMTAAKSLAKGDWKRCETLLLSLNVWNLLQNTDQVKAMLRRKIQEEGLRTYLFTYSKIYDSISLDELWEMFELPKNTVHSLVSKMMIHEELRASWDQPSSSIVLHKVEPSKLQYLALQFAEKASNFVENNERLLDSLTGGYGYKETKAPQGKERWQDQENRPHRYPQRTYQQNRGRQQQYHNYRSQQQDHFQQHRKGLADSGSLHKSH